ncbi:MAG: ABC transporter ATP-binding protein [Acidobacteria bacterium]|nr:ABC transporter ATP-binding protein [Acidobacteriota bacterium]
MGNVIIDISSYSFRIGDKEILKEVSLTVHEGEYVSIVGPNGAGKTTLLKCISRIHRGGRGSIAVAGRRLEEYSQKELALKVSYVPQADGRHAPFTVREFILMGRYPYLSPFSPPGPSDTGAVREAMEVTGTSEFSERFLGTLSGGERQKVYIAAALAQEAQVLLLDEPTTFLDPRHESDIYRLLAGINRERGVTIVSVTHDINSAVLTSRTVLALKGGAVAFCGPAEEFMNEEILRNIYEKSFSLMQHPQYGRTIIAPEVP